MRLPRIPGFRGGVDTVAGLASFIRARLGEVSDTLAVLARRAEPSRALPGRGGQLEDARAAVVSAAAPFAPTSYARARLLRQMHACGLLSEDETEQAQRLLGVAQ